LRLILTDKGWGRQFPVLVGLIVGIVANMIDPKPAKGGILSAIASLHHIALSHSLIN